MAVRAFRDEPSLAAGRVSGHHQILVIHAPGPRSRLNAALISARDPLPAPGHIGVAENRAGEVIALPLRDAQPACVRPGRFLCATGNVKYRWRPSEVSYSTMAAEREYPTGRYLLNLTTAGRQG